MLGVGDARAEAWDYIDWLESQGLDPLHERASEPQPVAGDATSSSETRPSLVTDEVYRWGS